MNNILTGIKALGMMFGVIVAFMAGFTFLFAGPLLPFMASGEWGISLWWGVPVWLAWLWAMGAMWDS